MGLSIALAVLVINAFVGENGYFATLRARSDQAELEASLAALRLQNQRLQQERERLESDPAALEEAARRSLNLVRPGETLVIVRDAKTPASK
jgi:cell division protein FtsB